MLDVVILGGGIVGLATAYRFLVERPGLSLAVLEKENEIASHQTGHNSGVIHAGIYYRPGSLKARICRQGVGELVRFCEEHEVAYELCGKLIVAASEAERPRLHALLERGRANGVPGLRIVSREEMAELEPHAGGIEAIHSPQTGIVSFRSVADKMARAIEERGGSIRTGVEARGIRGNGAGSIVLTTGGAFQAKLVVSAAGLHADRVAALGGAGASVRVIPFRGEYYRLKPERRDLIRNLIYPVPDPRFPFLGVHFTRRIDGEVEAGPNAVLAFAREGYRTTDIDVRDMWDMLRFPGFWRMGRKHWRMAAGEYYRSLWKPAFVRGLQRLVPEVTSVDIEEGGSGVRAQALERNGELVDDFRVLRRGNVIHILNAPSPAATSALAIGRYIYSSAFASG